MRFSLFFSCYVSPTGKSLLVSTLLERQKVGLHGREEREFAALVKGLLKSGNILTVSEVLQVLIEPLMIVKNGRDLEKLVLPLDLLKVRFC